MAGTNHVDCESVRALIPAYSIGATDPDETRLVELALADCPQAADELAEYLALAQALHYTRPRRPGQPQRKPAPARTAPRPASPAPHPKPAPRRLWWPVAAAAALILIILGGANLLLFGQLNQIRQEQQRIAAIAEQLAQPETPTVWVADTTRHRALQPTDAGVAGAKAVLMWDAEANIGSLYAEDLQPLPPGMVYQLWLVRNGTTHSLGTFTVDAAGTGSLVFQSLEPIESFDAVGISPEPAQGSSTPTHEHIAIGDI